MNPLKEYSNERFNVRNILNFWLGNGKRPKGEVTKSILIISWFLDSENKRAASWIRAWKFSIWKWGILGENKGRWVRMMKNYRY